MSEFSVDIVSVGEAAVSLRCHGDIDAHTCGELDKVLTGVLAGGVRYAIVDFSDVGYTASRGMGVLISARKHLEDRGGGIALLKPNESVAATIQVLGFDNVFPIADTEAGALEALGAS